MNFHPHNFWSHAFPPTDKLLEFYKDNPGQTIAFWGTPDMGNRFGLASYFTVTILSDSIWLKHFFVLGSGRKLPKNIKFLSPPANHPAFCLASTGDVPLKNV